MNWIRLAGAIAIALMLIGLLVWFGDLDLASFKDRLLLIGGWWPAIVALSAIQLGLSALKWRMVLAALEPDMARQHGFSFYVFFTSAAAVLSQFITAYAASILIRSIAIRANHTMSLMRGAVSSGGEQVFDVMILCAMLAPTILCLALGGGVLEWFALVGVMLVVLVSSLSVAFKLLARAKQWQHGRGEWIGRLLSRGDQLVQEMRGSGLLRGNLSTALTALSALRYLFMLLRALCIAVAAGYMIPTDDLIFGFSVAQASQLASITPGNLGVAEWSWTSFLTLRGTALETAIEFTLVLRVGAFLSLLPVLALSGLALSRHASRRLKTLAL